MRWIMRTVVAVVVVVASAAAAGFLLPQHAQVVRTARIDAPPAVVFPLINDLRAAQVWSPWLAKDPGATTHVSGPDAGVGQTLTWTSDILGNGTQTITASEADRSVTSALDFAGAGGGVATIALAPDGTGTAVTWTLDADMGANPFQRYVGLMLDGLIGGDFADDLARLGALAKSRAATRTAAP